MTTHKLFTKTFLTSLFLGIGAFLYGYDSGIIAPSLALGSFNRYFDKPSPPLRGAIVSVYQAGAWVGSASIGVTSDRLGRRKAILFGCIWGVIGAVLMSGAAHVAMLVLGRFFVGFGVATIAGVAPMFGAEIAKTHERARLTGINNMMLSWGFFVALWTGVGEGKWSNPNQWRLGFAIQGVPALLLGAGVMFIDESPRWLLLKGRVKEAEASFRNYHYDKTNDEWCSTNFATIRANIAEETNTQHSLSWGQLLGNRAFRKRLFVGSFVWAAAMLAGISFVQYFQTAIYATLQYNESQQLLIAGIYGSVSPIACIAALFFVDRIGRRKILVTGSSLLSICYMIVTILAAVFPARPGMPTNAAAQRGLIACIIAINTIYPATLGPMTWIIPPEVFTTELRAKGNSIVQVIHYSISLIVTQCSPIALDAVGWKYYILFILTNALCAIVFFITYPETKGKSLEEMADIFGDVNVIRRETGVLSPEKAAMEGSESSEGEKV